jgi:hypothetical protein
MAGLLIHFVGSNGYNIGTPRASRKDVAAMSQRVTNRYRDGEGNRTLRPILCSSCFSDPGLRIEAEKIGRVDKRACPNCGKQGGAKLSQSQLETLLTEFFWNGSFSRAEFGGAHRLVSNPHRYGEREVRFPEWLEPDARLLEDKLQVGLFHYGPPLWRIGEIEQLQNLRDPQTRTTASLDLVNRFPERVLKAGSTFFRVRKNLSQDQEQDFGQYDAPPDGFIGNGRLDSSGLPVLYGSENLEICIHECRVVITDECYVATLEARRDLHLLDLTLPPFSDGPTPFESLDISMRFLFSADAHSYPITRDIALTAKTRGFDGIVYPSYFSLVKPNAVANLAIFGRPIGSGAVGVRAINRAQLTSAIYDVRMGPLFS